MGRVVKSRMSGGAAGSPQRLTIEGRFRGPASSGNGGVTAGLLASTLGAGEEPVMVTLRQPPPLDTVMDVRAAPEDHAGVQLWGVGDLLVAEAVPGRFAARVVDPVDFATATTARMAYRGNTNHPFPACFVCGPDRGVGDGMRLTPGLIATGRTACVWMPDPSLAARDDASVTAPEFGWAALDCPGGWTSDIEQRPMVLGRMTAALASWPRIGRPHVVVGQLLREEGRKTFTATSLYDDGRLVGRAEHTWIQVDPASFET
jgi:hypothetical protein